MHLNKILSQFICQWLFWSTLSWLLQPALKKKKFHQNSPPLKEGRQNVHRFFLKDVIILENTYGEKWLHSNLNQTSKRLFKNLCSWDWILHYCQYSIFVTLQFKLLGELGKELLSVDAVLYTLCHSHHHDRNHLCNCMICVFPGKYMFLITIQQIIWNFEFVLES